LGIEALFFRKEKGFPATAVLNIFIILI